MVKSLGPRASVNNRRISNGIIVINQTGLRTELLGERGHGRCGGSKDLCETLGLSSLGESSRVGVDGGSRKDRDSAECKGGEGGDVLEQHDCEGCGGAEGCGSV